MVRSNVRLLGFFANKLQEASRLVGTFELLTPS
jgi:hypothetical protein